jgi:hypothetical protein
MSVKIQLGAPEENFVALYVLVEDESNLSWFDFEQAAQVAPLVSSIELIWPKGRATISSIDEVSEHLTVFAI